MFINVQFIIKQIGITMGYIRIKAIFQITYGEELIEYVVKCNLSLWQSKCFCNSLIDMKEMNKLVFPEKSHTFFDKVIEFQ